MSASVVCGWGDDAGEEQGYWVRCIPLVLSTLNLSHNEVRNNQVSERMRQILNAKHKIQRDKKGIVKTKINFKQTG